MCAWVHGCACVHVCTWVHVDRGPPLHTCMHTCLHTYIHACMHAYILAYIHTCMHSRHELLERLGLQPLTLGVALRAGDQVSLLPSAEEMMASATPIECVVAESAGEYEPTVSK